MKKRFNRHVKFSILRRSVLIWLLSYTFFAVFLLPGAAGASFTVEDEKKLGKEFYDKLKDGNFLVQNERISGYITRIGERILAFSDRAPFDFKFSVIKSTAVNAFATPGGYVYLNQGLINLVDNESELAGVLAHEIAHVNGRHIAEIIDRSRKLSISTLAAIIAGAFLGGGGDLTAAVASFSMATATALSLKYSRQQEEAADRSGMSYLVAAGYNGKAMLDFLKTMGRYEYYSNTVPSYFLTHPGTDERYRYIDALLQTTYGSVGAAQILGGLKRTQILLLLDAKVPNANLSYFQKELEDRPDDPDLLYGLAMTEDRLGMTEEALEHFKRALRNSPEDPEILRDLGITSFKIGRLEEAEKHLRQAVKIMKNDIPANLYLGKTIEALGDVTGALHLYQQLEKEYPSDPEIFYSLGMSYGKSGLKGQSHYYFGRYFMNKGKAESALFHLRAAQDNLPKDDPKYNEIKKQLDSLQKGKSDTKPEPEPRRRRFFTETQRKEVIFELPTPAAASPSRTLP